MPPVKPHYTPTENTDDEDREMHEALEGASFNQLAGFVDDLLEKSDSEAEGSEKT